MVKYLDKEQNYSEITSENRILVDFYADWCGPCKMLGPVLEELVKEDTSITVLKVNVDEFRELALEHGVTSIPALFYYEEGKIVKKGLGYMPLRDLKNFVS